jgi:hypothetical protein
VCEGRGLPIGHDSEIALTSTFMLSSTRLRRSVRHPVVNLLAVLRAGTLAAVAFFKCVYDLVRAHGDSGWTERLLPAYPGQPDLQPESLKWAAGYSVLS